MSFDLERITRKNIWTLKPYSSARDEFTGQAKIFLDANENPYDMGYNRYPDPYQMKLKERIAHLKNVKTDNIIFGNGSDEVIDLLFRTFCEPEVDEVMILPPTYGMYQVYADINNVKINSVPLTPEEFDIDLDKVKEQLTPQTKIIWLCSPNNPTGNSLNPQSIQSLLQTFNGIVVVDEAYIDFSQEETWVNFLSHYPNLFVMQTFSKAWGLAGLRLGMGFGSKEIIDLLNKVKPPYNINTLTQEKAVEIVGYLDEKNKKVDEILKQRESLAGILIDLDAVHKIYRSDANFILVKIDNATDVYNALIEKSIIVRNRSTVELCEDCLRITIGTPKENSELVKALYDILK